MARAARHIAADEAPPEADQLEGVLHPRLNGMLVGQSHAARELLEAFSSGRMHHGWLLTGPEGIGKATLAYLFARTVLTGGRTGEGANNAGTFTVDMDTGVSRQVSALSHPGLLVIRRQWDAKRKKHQSLISVDDVRRLRSFLGLSAGDGGWRVVVVDRADEMNVNAANALLKSLEEPPARCLFLLVTSEPGRLPVTIHSRCRRLVMPRLAADDLQVAVRHVVEASELDWPEDVDWALLHRLANGSVRRALTLIADDGLTLYRQLIGILGVLPKIDWPVVHGLAESVAPVAQEARFNLLLDLLSDVLARMLRQAVGGAPGDDEESVAARKIMPRERLAPWAELWETLGRERTNTRVLNLDRQNFVLSVFQKMEAVAGGQR